jgi:glycosyltransferase involved in cell wall biosynthesis
MKCYSYRLTDKGKSSLNKLNLSNFFWVVDMNLLLITPYVEQKKGPFIWAKNFYEKYSIDYGNISVLTFDENINSSNYDDILVHKGFNLEKKIIKYPFLSLTPSIITLERKKDISIVQTNDTLVAFCALMAKKITGVPVVLRIGGEYFTEINNWGERISINQKVRSRLLNKIFATVFKKIGFYTMRRVDQLVSINSYMKNYLHNYGFDSIIIPNAIDISKYDLNNPNLSENYLLCISNMDIPKKVEGIIVLFNALLILRKNGFEMKLMIAGDGSLRDYLEDYARKIGIDNSVVFLGVRQDIPELLSKCTIYVHSSLQDVFPNSILEAMASKKPVVAINVGGVPEIITHNSNGILCDPSSEELSKSLILLLQNNNLTEKIRRAGFDTVNSRYTWAKVVELYYSQYQKVLN